MSIGVQADFIVTLAQLLMPALQYCEKGSIVHNSSCILET